MRFIVFGATDKSAPEPDGPIVEMWVCGEYSAILFDGVPLIQRKTAMMKGWKTIAFNAAVAVVGVLAMTNWVDVIPENYVGTVVAMIGFVNMWLRSLTKTPVGT